MDSSILRYAESVASALTSILGSSNVTGVYLHGSSVLGGLNPHKSDIDILAICKTPITTYEQTAIADQLSEEQLPCPALGLEMSIVTLETTKIPTESPAFEFHMSTDPTDSKLVDGHDREGDPGLVVDFAVCRQAGRPLAPASRPVHDVFAPIPKKTIVSRGRKELSWAADPENAPAEYAVLNACRLLKFATDGIFLSKIDGGQWVLDRDIVPKQHCDVVQTAIDLQRSLPAAKIHQKEVEEFIDEVLLQIN